MAKLPINIWRETMNEWLKTHKDADSRFDVPYKYVESRFRLEGYGKKAAFDWIVDLTELSNATFDGHYIHLPN